MFGSQKAQNIERKISHVHSVECDRVMRDIRRTNSSMRESSFAAEKCKERCRGNVGKVCVCTELEDRRKLDR